MPKKITKEAISGGTDMLFAGMTPKTEQPADEEKNLKKKSVTTKKKEPAEEKPQKAAGRVFGVWLQETTIDRINAYTEATGRKKTDIVAAALNEYMNRHKLTDDQKAAYQKKQKEKQKTVIDL